MNALYTILHLDSAVSHTVETDSPLPENKVINTSQVGITNARTTAGNITSSKGWEDQCSKFGRGKIFATCCDVIHSEVTETCVVFEREKSQTYARLYNRGSKLDPRSDLRSTQKTVAPFEFRAELEIEIKFISNSRNWWFEISIRDQQPSSWHTRIDMDLSIAPTTATIRSLRSAIWRGNSEAYAVSMMQPHSVRSGDLGGRGTRCWPSSHARPIHRLGSPSKVKKRGSDTGDTNTHAYQCYGHCSDVSSFLVRGVSVLANVMDMACPHSNKVETNFIHAGNGRNSRLVDNLPPPPPWHAGSRFVRSPGAGNRTQLAATAGYTASEFKYTPPTPPALVILPVHPRQSARHFGDSSCTASLCGATRAACPPGDLYRASQSWYNCPCERLGKNSLPITQAHLLQRARRGEGCVFSPRRQPGKTFQRTTRMMTVVPLQTSLGIMQGGEDRPKAQRIGFDSWLGHCLISTCGNHAERCRWSGGFRNLPFPPPLHSCAAPHSPHFTLIGSQDPDVKYPACLHRFYPFFLLRIAGAIKVSLARAKRAPSPLRTGLWSEVFS
ncbi:hypothetical protein PR048_032110 [Dryococelus australis]|uniref:Uncharacterized protein n=1 Tax=Dryococelus australis TaxID=614101 RepID=A0ABQ9G2G7_9NEOP|nr:hypothetical protein PR048_032110 [Dryococelus australis]